MRKLSKWLVQEYLASVTVGWFIHHDVPADRVEEYDGHIEEIRVSAVLRNEMEVLRTAAELILSDPGCDCDPPDSSNYGFTSDAMRAILARVYRRLWPDAPYPPARPRDAELSTETWDEWRRQQGHVVHKL